MEITLEKQEVINKIQSIIDGLFADEQYIHMLLEDGTIDNKLQMLTSESMLALVLVTSIEDEFDIEFEDDEIDYSFFSSFESVVDLTIKYIKN